MRNYKTAQQKRDAVILDSLVSRIQEATAAGNDKLLIQLTNEYRQLEKSGRPIPPPRIPRPKGTQPDSYRRGNRPRGQSDHS